MFSDKYTFEKRIDKTLEQAQDGDFKSLNCILKSTGNKRIVYKPEQLKYLDLKRNRYWTEIKKYIELVKVENNGLEKLH